MSANGKSVLSITVRIQLPLMLETSEIMTGECESEAYVA